MLVLDTCIVIVYIEPLREPLVISLWRMLGLQSFHVSDMSLCTCSCVYPYTNNKLEYKRRVLLAAWSILITMDTYIYKAWVFAVLGCHVVCLSLLLVCHIHNMSVQMITLIMCSISTHLHAHAHTHMQWTTYKWKHTTLEGLIYEQL